MKDVSCLTVADLRRHPVWIFTNSDARGETLVRPVERLPAKSLASSLVGTEVVLANGQKVFAMLGNVHLENPRATEQFMKMCLYREDGKSFDLARYHDYDYADRGPAKLAKFLGLKKKEVFPIAWDVSAVAKAFPEALKGTVREIPRERLSRAEWIALAVPTANGT